MPEDLPLCDVDDFDLPFLDSDTKYLPFYLYDADLEDFLEVAQPSSRTGSKNVGLKAGLFV